MRIVRQKEEADCSFFSQAFYFEVRPAEKVLETIQRIPVHPSPIFLTVHILAFSLYHSLFLTHM